MFVIFSSGGTIPASERLHGECPKIILDGPATVMVP